MRSISIYLALILVGCSGAGSALTFGDGGDASDPGDAQAGDGSVGDGGGGESVLDGGSDADAQGADGGDGFDGHTLSPYRRVFITSKVYAPDFGGLAGADKICNVLATGQGLGGTWAAWLSSTTVSAASRLEHAIVPYQLLDGTVIATNWTDLTSGSIRHNIDRDETNTFVPLSTTWPAYSYAWTATQANGDVMLASLCCNDWTYASPTNGSTYEGTMGGPDTYDGGSADHEWTVAQSGGCYGKGSPEATWVAALYCFEQP